jgi:hypothetical protein
MSKKEADLSEELDKWGFPIDPAERMQQAMLAFYEMVEAAQMADFFSRLAQQAETAALEFHRRVRATVSRLRKRSRRLAVNNCRGANSRSPARDEKVADDQLKPHEGN